jgi:hypothetical protein
VNKAVQHAVKEYRKARDPLEMARAEEVLWNALRDWRDNEVREALERFKKLAHSAPNIADLWDRLDAFDGES